MDILATMTPAEKYYKKHLLNVSKYKKTHVEQMREKCKKCNMKIKEDPAKYNALLEKRENIIETKK